MKYLLDSDRVADYLKGRQEAVELLSSLAGEGLAMSIMSLGEIYEGIYYGRDPAANEEGFRKFLRGVRILPLTRPIMQRFARIRGELRRSGQLIGDPDILIGVTAVHHDVMLVTQNVRHFRRIPGLQLLEPSSPAN